MSSPAPLQDSPAANASTTSTTPVRAGRTLLIHGYSADGSALIPWKQKLAAAGIDTATIAIGNYVTLNNEVTIKDLGEAFDRALRLTPWSTAGKDDHFTFDAIVHSTGMLVLRQWLVSDPFDRDDPRSRIRRLKHLVGLAPATFGSPQAAKGRSFLGALVKGNKHLGPDFLNAGNQVLAGLELASAFTWQLAHKDMICPKPLYQKNSNTPYVTVFIGNTPYTGLDALSNDPGDDGTVRWAGCALNTRKVSVDFRREPRLTDNTGAITRLCLTPWCIDRLAAPMIAVNGKNHGTLVSEPDPAVAQFIHDFFLVADQPAYDAWEEKALTFGATSLPRMNAAAGADGAGWQQLVVHMVDDHGDGVDDYNLQLFIGNDLAESTPADPDLPDDILATQIPLIVDTYSQDASFRCFYLRLTEEMLAINTPGAPSQLLWLELIASSGSDLLEYEAYTADPGPPQDLITAPANPAQSLTVDHNGGKPVKLDLTPLITGNQSLFYPYTTTLLEIFVEREPLPLNAVSQIFNFLP